MPVTELKTPTPEELFSGRPVEWAPFDTDARYLRWGSRGFRIVEKGEDAKPRLREVSCEKLTDLDKEKLWRLTQASGSSKVEYERPTYGSREEQFVFALPRQRAEMPPGFSSSRQVFSLTHELRLTLLESRTGRGDLLLSFARRISGGENSVDGANTPAMQWLDLSASTLGLRSNCDDHILSRPLIDSPHLVVFQNIRAGESFDIVVERPATIAKLSMGDIVFMEPNIY